MERDVVTVDGSAHLGQAPDLAALLPSGMMYVALSTPLGNAVIDPFAAAQDPTTQGILQALGINVTIGLGAPPAALTAGPALGENLKTLALVGGGLLLVLLLSRR